MPASEAGETFPCYSKISIFPRWWRHELGANRLCDCVAKDPIDLLHVLFGQRPAEDLFERVELARVANSPEGDRALVQNPTNGKLQDLAVVPFFRKIFQPGNSFEILRKAGRLELGSC